MSWRPQEGEPTQHGHQIFTASSAQGWPGYARRQHWAERDSKWRDRASAVYSHRGGPRTIMRLKRGIVSAGRHSSWTSSQRKIISYRLCTNIKNETISSKSFPLRRVTSCFCPLLSKVLHVTEKVEIRCQFLVDAPAHLGLGLVILGIVERVQRTRAPRHVEAVPRRSCKHRR